VDTAKSSKPEWFSSTLIIKGKRLLATACSREELLPLLREVKKYRPECEYTMELLSQELAQKKGSLGKMWRKGHRFSLWQVMPKPDNSALDD
jgi:hypothetical protein